MVEAHEADPHVQALREAHAGWQAKADALAAEARAAPSHAEFRARSAEAAAAREKAGKAEEALAHESRRSALLSFGVPHAEQPRFEARDISSYNRAERVTNWGKARDFLQGVSSKDGAGGQEVTTDHAKGGRASYSAGTVRTARGDGPEIAAHEFGHHLEERDDVRARVREFSEKRFGSEPYRDMAAVAPRQGYRPGEEAGRRDDLTKVFGDEHRAYYAGKTYSDGRSEVLSMGLEQLYRDPVHLARTDPPYFSLVLGILQGRKGK
jgi:hypothetical protein